MQAMFMWMFPWMVSLVKSMVLKNYSLGESIRCPSCNLSTTAQTHKKNIFVKLFKNQNQMNNMNNMNNEKYSSRTAGMTEADKINNRHY